MFGSESLRLRLAKPEKCEFTVVNDHFEGKHNEYIGLYGHTLISRKSIAWVLTMGKRVQQGKEI